MTDADRLRQIRHHSTERNHPDGEIYIGIGTEAIKNLSLLFGIPGRELEITALENSIIPERYARNRKTFSAEEQIRLLQSAVTVVGLGGLGGTVVEILARAGVGKLRLIDGDCFEDSNLNRQLFSTLQSRGIPKADTAALRIAQINPSLTVEKQAVFLNAENAPDLLKGSDAVADCLDSMKIRFVLESATKNACIPLISAAVAGTAGHVTVIFPEDRGLENIYGPAEFLEEKGSEQSLGCPAYAVFLLSSLEASEVIKILLNKKDTLRNRLLIADLRDNTFEIMNLI